MIINTPNTNHERENMLLESYIWRQRFLFFSHIVRPNVTYNIECGSGLVPSFALTARTGWGEND
jgi:hypothetical protein